MADDRAFFEIAAALLPALMLGALFAEKLKPPKGPVADPGWPYWAILYGGTFFLLAETLAITAAITGEPTGFDRVVVSAALVVASLGIVFLLLVGWVEMVPRARRRRHLIPTLLLLLVAGGGGVRVLIGAVETTALQEKSQELQERRDEQSRLLTELQQIYAREGRLEREQSRLFIRETNLLARREEPGLQGKLLLVRQDIQSVRAQLRDLNLRARGISLELEVVAADPERIRELAP